VRVEEFWNCLEFVGVLGFLGGRVFLGFQEV